MVGKTVTRINGDLSDAQLPAKYDVCEMLDGRRWHAFPLKMRKVVEESCSVNCESKLGRMVTAPRPEHVANNRYT